MVACLGRYSISEISDFEISNKFRSADFGSARLCTPTACTLNAGSPLPKKIWFQISNLRS